MMPTAWEPAASSGDDGVSDEELVLRFRAGNVSAFDQLFQRYEQPLCKYLVGLVGENCAYDLAQDIFIVAYRKLPSMQKVLNFRAWLYQVVTNLARDYWRHIRLIQWLPWVEHKELSADGHIFAAGPELQVEEAEFISKVMSWASPKYRPCLYLDIFEDMRQHEIADLLGMAERTVRRYIFLGKEELRKAYNDYFTSGEDSIAKRRTVQ